MDELAGRRRKGENQSHYGGAGSPRKTPPPRAKAPAVKVVRHAPGHAPPHRGKHAATHTTEPAFSRDYATVRAFDSGSYTATISLARSPDVTIAGVPVSRAIGASVIVAGQTAAVLFFDRQNNADAMIVGVY